MCDQGGGPRGGGCSTKEFGLFPILVKLYYLDASCVFASKLDTCARIYIRHGVFVTNRLRLIIYTPLLAN